MSLLIGLALGASVSRSMATGLYLVGCFLLILGVVAGVRGPLRPAGKDEAKPIGSLLGVGFFSKGVRQATGEERSDARGTAWLFLALGMAMIFAGMIVDPRMRVF